MNLKLDVVRFVNEDVITTSGGPLSGKSGFFYIPTSQYTGSISGTPSEYVQFWGTLGNYNGSAYVIDDISGAHGGADSDYDVVMAKSYHDGYVWFEELGVPVDPTDFMPIAQQGYDAFSYGDGVYYTNGLSFYDQYWQ